MGFASPTGGSSQSASSGAGAGDVSAGFDFSLATNNAFSVGGSGVQSTRSDASGATGNPNANANVSPLPPSQQKADNLPLLIALGVVGLVSVAAVIRKK